MFHFYHEVNNIDFSKYQIFSLEQMSNEVLPTEHCLKYFNIDSDIIECARDIIKDVYHLKIWIRYELLSVLFVIYPMPTKVVNNIVLSNMRSLEKSKNLK